ncbi:MAG: hypothetical protein HYZ65_05520 [Burkholderiales bacterium]|nr:hypothetical protein [Burkholderiales bacterium]
MSRAELSYDHCKGRRTAARFGWSLLLLMLLGWLQPGRATVVEFNSGGGTNASNGLHFYVEDSTHLQVKGLDGSGQLNRSNKVPPQLQLKNGVFLRTNGRVYGPGYQGMGGGGATPNFSPDAGMFGTHTISAVSPGNPSANGVQQVATNNLGVTGGPQISIVWKYTTPQDYLTAQVSITIPSGYPVSAGNPVRYYHVIDPLLNNLGACGVKYTDGNGKLVIGTYTLASGSGCPSGTALPANADRYAAFREVSGKSFSSYCAAGANAFFSNGGVNCSIEQSAALSNTIVGTAQDTGIGVAFDFSASGTYSFSYDFVLGMMVAPDHLEIRHDGSATLCPENLTVLACRTSGVPCNASDIINTGTITGKLTASPLTPAVSFNPATFSVGAGGGSATVLMQGSGGATYTLGAANISGMPPVNGVKCWNTATNSASCSMVVSNTACAGNFECMETGKSYNNLVGTPAARNPLYTKLAGTDFKFDVLALQSSGAVATAYNGNVTVELFDDSATPAPACSAYSAPVASQSLSFLTTDKGRKTLASAVNLPRAYRKLRCRVKDSTLNPVVVGCSSDDFTVRPVAITSLTSTTATADSSGASATNTPLIKAGAAFALAAGTGTAGYDDKPKINSALLQWSSLPAGGSMGSISGAFTTAAGASGSGAIGSAFTYSEVGYFRFLPQGVYDDSFTTYSGDAVNGDCLSDPTNGASNSPDADGKYGCRFGNTASSAYFGRFIPDHFSVLTPATFDGYCTAGGFIYMDQTFNLRASIEARNASNGKTLNYSAGFARGAVTPQMENNNSGVPLDISRLNWSGSWGNGVYTFSANQFKRLAVADGPYDALAFGLGVTDEGGQVVLADRDMDASNTACTADMPGTPGNCPAKQIAGSKLRYGRVKLGMAHGSELLALPLPLRLEYWSGGGWQINTLDSCTNFAAGNFSLAFPAGTAAKPNNLAACVTMLSVAGSAPAQKLQLSAPGRNNNGWTDVTLNLDEAAGNQCAALGGAGPAALGAGLPWLQFNWSGSGAKNPAARATFGVYKNANEFIYLRELH